MPTTTAPLTIPHVLADAARRWPREDALVDQGRRWTYSELAGDSRRAAAAFAAAGIRKGDRVAIWAPNSAEWILAATGAQTLGAIIVPLNTRLKGKEAGFILRRSRARILITVTDFLGTNYPALLAGEDLPTLETIVLVSGADDRNLPWAKFLEGGAAVSEGTIDAALAALTPDDLADIMFTSGTTGEPKGVMSAHGQNIRVYQAWIAAVGLLHGDHYLIVNPFFHTFGYKAGWIACLIQGAVIYPVPVFDVGVVMQRILQDRISVVPGPPTLFQSLLAHEDIGRADLSSLRLAVTGAATVPPILIEQMRTVLGFKSVITAYGLTESTGTATACRPGDSDEIVATTCGVAIPGTEVKCVDANGRDLPAGEAGEVLVRGFNVMQGYLDDPVATAQTIDADRWLHTGDVGVIDANGYLRITDRMKDMFIVGGFNCYPAEIEKILASHPAIAQVAVIGVPDERMGEVGKAYVVLRKDATLAAAELIRWSRDNMANYKVPRFVEIVASLPTNASGKIQKFALRQS